MDSEAPLLEVHKIDAKDRLMAVSASSLSATDGLQPLQSSTWSSPSLARLIVERQAGLVLVFAIATPEKNLIRLLLLRPRCHLHLDGVLAQYAQA